MILETLDWIIIASFLLLSLYIGLKYKNQGSSSLDSFFLGGRNLPWYIAGMSMVATTFAADTPLAVTELVAKKRNFIQLDLVEFFNWRNAYHLLFCKFVEKSQCTYRIRIN
jgi:hypothetical protein